MTTVETVILQKVTRVEVIGPDGREYTRYDVGGVIIDHQDDGKTLKVFLRHDRRRN